MSVDRFTKRYITPLLWKDQLATFEASPRSFDNMEVCLGDNCVKWLCVVFIYLYTYLQLFYCSFVYLYIYVNIYK